MEGLHRFLDLKDLLNLAVRVRVLPCLQFPFKESFSCVNVLLLCQRTFCCLEVQHLPGQDGPSDRLRSEFASHRVSCSACLHTEL